ncbi:hypothetical protein [Olivibacter sitiensis]|uniref:hypothetical protein n=1 Tax=Olivibacter sitiensis TaxID=376470 RepID=UPI00041F1055|nr:hypothetical protein [Olivibacter sitiensis]
MNKYLKRGLILTLAGIGLGALGMYFKELELGIYEWLLILSVILFGIGFCTIIYALMRRIDRQSILEARSESHENDDNKKEDDSNKRIDA